MKRSDAMPHRILLVDDDRLVRASLGRHLARVGHQIEEATDGADAIARIASGKAPCLVLLDMRMPRMNGTEFLGFRRTLPSLRSIPVVRMSAQYLAPADEPALEKPFDMSEVHRAIEKHARCQCGSADAHAEPD